MKSLARASAIVLFALAVASCGGGGGGGGGDTGGGPVPGVASIKPALDSAAGNAGNDTSVNSSASFAVVQNAGVPAVTVNSPPKVNFAVFSDGKINSSVVPGSVSFTIAKLVPGTNGDSDRWVSYIYRTRAAATATATGTFTPAVKATLTAPKLPSAIQAFNESGTVGQLVLNPDGYYTYTFKTDIKNPAQTNGVVFEPGRTHRIAIQLTYLNAAGTQVFVNPTFDFTVDGAGNSVPVTDPSQDRKVVDVATCNSCHQKLAHHGAGRVDTQYCVMCHNPGNVDPNSGNSLNFATMVHKIHAAKLLASQVATGGELYTIRTDDLSDIGFPQDLRNCAVCHSGANPATPQGDNWKTKASREACLTCHTSAAGTNWFTQHTFFNRNRDPNAAATQLPNSECVRCHAPGTSLAPERVHFNQVQADAAKYKMNIESAVFDGTARVVNVKYFLSDPTNGDAAYNLVTPDCTGAGATLACANTTQFGNLRLYLAYPNMAGQPGGVTEFTSFNNGGGNANVFAYKGVNDGSNHYTAQIPVPADVPGISVASGTGRVMSVGQVKEPKLQAQAIGDPRPPVSPAVLVSVGVQNTAVDIALTGALLPRRQVVATEKCNVCHGMLGTASASNTLANAFHGGARNIVEACVVCHDPNRMSTTIMTNGLALNESFQFKRMIHGIHANSKRTYPFTHGNTVVGAFNKDGTSATGGAPLASTVENYAAEVLYPDTTLNCNACHVNDSFKVDRSPMGAVVSKPAGVTDPMQWLVISPKAATCTSCHDSPQAIGHVTSFGNATFGDRTQAQSLQTQEVCADCHAPGVFKGVDIVHGQK